MHAVRSRQRTCPKRRKNRAAADGRLPEAVEIMAGSSESYRGYRQRVPWCGIDDDVARETVADRDSTGVVAEI